jgi:hypothetical protein
MQVLVILMINKEMLLYLPKPYQSWILNEDTCLWEAPVAKPNDENNYNWNEITTTWDLVE